MTNPKHTPKTAGLGGGAAHRSKVPSPSSLERRIWSLKLDKPGWYKAADLLPTAALAYAWWDSEKVSDGSLSEAAADWVLSGESAENFKAAAARRLLREVSRYLRTQREGAR